MKRKLFSQVLCLMLLMATALTATPVSAAYTKGTDGAFLYEFAFDGDWDNALNLAKQTNAKFEQSAAGNETGSLRVSVAGGTAASSAGINGVVMQENKQFVLTGDICYENADKLSGSALYLSAYLTNLKGAKLYSDPECTQYVEDAVGGFVSLSTAVDKEGKSFKDGKWHTYEVTVPVKGAKHSTGKYVDLTGIATNIWFRPFGGANIGITESFFTADYLTECGYVKGEAEEGKAPVWTPAGEEYTVPAAECLIDNFQGKFKGLPREGVLMTDYLENDDGTFFYPFNKAEDVNKTKVTIAKESWVSFAQRDADGKNTSGMLKMVKEAGSGINSSGVNGVVPAAEEDFIIRGDIRFENATRLNAKNTYIAIYLTGLKGVKLYADAACTEYVEDAVGGFVQLNVTTDIHGNSFADGEWHTFSVNIPAKAKHSTGKYIDLSGVSTHLWFRPFSGSAPAATTDYFTQEYLDACAGDGTTPAATIYLDNLESYYGAGSAISGYYKDDYTIHYPFDTAEGKDVQTIAGNRRYMESYLGKSGVVAVKTEAGKDISTSTFNIKMQEGKKLRIAGDIALTNGEKLNAAKYNVNALLILNGGSSNNPAGFYEDEACTIPCESVNGNAICFATTLQAGIQATDWTRFSYDLDTDKVYKGSIKRAASDAARTTVYIKPWEVTGASVWFRVLNESATGTKLVLGTNSFTSDYLTECGYKLDDTGAAWIADPDKAQTIPYMEYALDRLSISNVTEGEISADDIQVTNLEADKTTLNLGDTVTVTYDLESGIDFDSRVFLLADGAVVKTARTNNGAASFEVTRDLNGKQLAVKVVPKVQGVSANGNFVLDLGTVTSEMYDLKAEADDNGTMKWSYDVIGSVEAADVIATLYSKEGKLLKVDVTSVSAAENFDGVAAEGSITDPMAQYGKVMIWTSLAGMVPKVKPVEVSFAPIVDDPFYGDEEINVVFLGGSITYGEKAQSPAQNGYAGLTSAWLKETYEKDGVTVNCYNAGISGTPSEYGLLRLERDVISKNPDLVFVEFAVNDGNTDSRYAMESIVRSLAASETNPYIVFLYATNENYTTNPTYHKQVASLYGIPEISLKDALYEALQGENPKTAGYFKDSVHPTEEGHRIYFEAIRDTLSLGRHYARPTITEEKLVGTSGAVTTSFIDLTSDAVTRSSEWETGTNGNGTNYVTTEWTDETLSFTFTGNILAVEHALNQASNQYEVYVDGEKVGTGDPYYQGVTWDQLALGFTTFDLEPGTHNVEIKTVTSTNPNTIGEQVKLYGVIVGSN